MKIIGGYMAYKFGNSKYNLSEREKLTERFNSARTNLLLVIILTVINIVSFVINSNSYFLFSASIPYAFSVVGVVTFMGSDVLVSQYALENGYIIGTEEYVSFESMLSTAITVFAVALIVIAVVILFLYFLAWLKSKNPMKSGWMIFALVFFSIDTVVTLINLIDSTDYLVDFIIQIYVLITLIVGVVASAKLKKLPPEETADNAPADVSGAYITTPAGEEIDPGFTYNENTTSTLNGESVDGKNEKL